jgi:NADH-quinone oxidoreductase subunit I
MYGKGLLKGLGITLKHAFEKDLTIQYPEEMPFLQTRFRGCLAFDFKKCIVCGMCTKACPNNVLSFETLEEEGSKKKKLLSYTIDLQYCLFCNLCVEVCPASCLYFTHDFELTKYKREEIKIVYHRPAELEVLPQKAFVSKEKKDRYKEGEENT